MSKNYIECKILLVGDGPTGKTSILFRYLEGNYEDQKNLTTIGIDSQLKSIQLNNGKTLRLKFIDTPGQERARSLVKNFYKKSDIIFLIYDVTDKKSFESIQQFYEQIKNETSEKIHIILLGNKIDKEGRQITKEQGEKLAKELGMIFFECSAKTGENINDIFDKIIEKYNDNENVKGKKGDAKKEKCYIF